MDTLVAFALVAIMVIDHTFAEASRLDTSSIEYRAAHHRADRCTIPALDGPHSAMAFYHDFFGREPVILRGLADSAELRSFLRRTSIDALYSAYGNVSVTLATANTYSHDKHVKTFREYVDEHVQKTVSVNEDADKILYWFGDHEEPMRASTSTSTTTGSDTAATNDGAGSSSFGELLAQYPIPEHAFHLLWEYDRHIAENGSSHYSLAATRYYTVLEQPDDSQYSARLSFGVGPAYSGTPFHYHSQVLAQMLHGSKRWFLFPHDHTTASDSSDRNFVQSHIVRPELSAIQWVHAVYVNDSQLLTSSGMLECVLHSGDILYIPDYWLHATLNIVPSVFISTFLYDEGRPRNPSKHRTASIEIPLEDWSGLPLS